MPAFLSCNAPELKLDSERPGRGHPPKIARSDIERSAQPLSRRAPLSYLPIAEHGVIGDMHSVALVGTDGTIDWYCPDRFDAPSVFGALLDAGGGGYFPHRADGAGVSGEAAVLPGHERAHHAVPVACGRWRGAGLHARR